METSFNTVHDFKKQLDYSEMAGHECFWQDVYKKAFPEMIFATLCTVDCIGQRSGIDRVIHLKNGKTLYIDEKKRKKVWPDFALEYISNDKTGSVGWMEKDLTIDYLAYAFMPLKKCYLLPWQNLKRVWLYKKDEWIKNNKIIKAENNGYTTLSVCVPIEQLLSLIKTSLIICV